MVDRGGHGGYVVMECDGCGEKDVINLAFQFSIPVGREGYGYSVNIKLSLQ